MKNTRNAGTGQFASRALLLSALLAILLGLAYRFIFLSPYVRWRGISQAVEGALAASIAIFMIISFASLSAVIAFHIRAANPLKIICATLSGTIVTIVIWLFGAQASGFPIVAGLVVALTFILVLVGEGERVKEGTGIVDELASVGFVVDSVDELRRSGVNYAVAVPALIRELTRETNPRKKEWIIRALSVPWARPAAIEPLIREFRTLPHDETRDNDNTRWAIGNAFEILWDDTYFEDFMAIAQERKYGRSRQMLVLGFGKSRRVEQAVDVLLELCDDATVEGHAVSALAKLAHPAARDALQKATVHSKAWVRKAAVRGLARLDRKAAG